jgi:hypothetical protein
VHKIVVKQESTPSLPPSYAVMPIDTDVENGGEDGEVKEDEKEKIEEADKEEEEEMVTPKKCGDIGTEGKPCGRKKHR